MTSSVVFCPIIDPQCLHHWLASTTGLTGWSLAVSSQTSRETASTSDSRGTATSSLPSRDPTFASLRMTSWCGSGIGPESPARNMDIIASSGQQGKLSRKGLRNLEGAQQFRVPGRWRAVVACGQALRLATYEPDGGSEALLVPCRLDWTGGIPGRNVSGSTLASFWHLWLGAGGGCTLPVCGGGSGALRARSELPPRLTLRPGPPLSAISSAPSQEEPCLKLAQQWTPLVWRALHTRTGPSMSPPEGPRGPLELVRAVVTSEAVAVGLALPPFVVAHS